MKSISLELLHERSNILRGGLRVTPIVDLLTDQFLLDKSLSRFLPRFRAHVQRLRIQKFRSSKIAFNVAGFHSSVADHNCYAVQYDRPAQDSCERKHDRIRDQHQNVCPMEKKN